LAATTATLAIMLCGHILAMLSVNDIAARQARILGNEEIMQTGKFRLQWLDTPHLPRNNRTPT
jgi:hypothetical protein